MLVEYIPSIFIFVVLSYVIFIGYKMQKGEEKKNAELFCLLEKIETHLAKLSSEVKK